MNSPTPTAISAPPKRILVASRWLWLTVSLALACLACANSGSDTRIGLPPMRSYSFDEIGVSRGAFLGFDRIGRLAVYDGEKYMVLNDSTWISLLEPSENTPSIISTANDSHGLSYFGSFGSWGLLDLDRQGKLVVESLRPDKYPSWVNTTNFDLIVPVEDGAFFAGINGVIHWNRNTNEQTFFQTRDLAFVFEHEGVLYVSSHTQPLQLIDRASMSLRPVDPENESVLVIDGYASTASGRAIISTTGQRLAEFNGEDTQTWENPLGTFQPAGISHLASLPGGEIAITLDNRGLYIIDAAGNCKLALANSAFQHVTRLACNEKGVLWVATENEVLKILYNDPASIVDQNLGLPVSWPKIVDWQGKPLVASGARIFEYSQNNDGLSWHFRQTNQGALDIKTYENQLLIGRNDGVYSSFGDTMTQIIDDFEANQVIVTGDGTAFAIGRYGIAALRWDGEKWYEAAPREASIGFPYISFAAERSAWIELGLDRAARLSLKDGKIEVRIFDSFPWKDPSWVNIGRVGDLITLSGGKRTPLFFDENKETLVQSDELERMFSEAPTPLMRVVEAPDGRIWSTHDHGISTASYSGDGYVFDERSFSSIRERTPLIHFTEPNHVWVSTGNSLYRLDRDYQPLKDDATTPLLVSITDKAIDEQLYSRFHHNQIPRQFSYPQNSLEFLFFTGTYNYTGVPAYEFRITNQASNWTTTSAQPTFSISNLDAGDYELSASLLESSLPFVSGFSIAPPWYRSYPAYLGYLMMAAALFYGAVALATARSKRRQVQLEELVHERTDTLRTTLEKLNEQDRKAAILSERNRIASEIHDSVQQGLSGLALQLDATLKLNGLEDSVHSRLSVARRMVSFTRHEVQQAVWDLESPLLDENNLGQALQKLADLINVNSTQVTVKTDELSYNLDSSTRHHLLRIAQEAITNAVRHGKARQIDITLGRESERVSLKVFDDGKGFDTHDVLDNTLGHFGLKGMRTRAAKIQATLEIVSAPGQGTTITVSIPAAQPD